MQPNYPPGAYNGVGRAKHLLDLLNGIQDKTEDDNKNDTDE